MPSTTTPKPGDVFVAPAPAAKDATGSSTTPDAAPAAPAAPAEATKANIEDLVPVIALLFEGGNSNVILRIQRYCAERDPKKNGVQKFAHSILKLASKNLLDTNWLNDGAKTRLEREYNASVGMGLTDLAKFPRALDYIEHRQQTAKTLLADLEDLARKIGVDIK